MNHSTSNLSQSHTPVSPRDTMMSPHLLERLSTRILAWFQIPEGYQDENGFHYGIQPKPARLTASDLHQSRQISTDRAEDAIIYASAAAPTTGHAQESRSITV